MEITQDTQHKNTQCKARLNLKYGNIKVKKYGKQWDFDADMDYKYEYITNASNWGEVYHNCSKYCESKCTAQHGICGGEKYQTDLRRKYRREAVLLKQNVPELGFVSIKTVTDTKLALHLGLFVELY